MVRLAGGAVRCGDADRGEHHREIPVDVGVHAEQQVTRAGQAAGGGVVQRHLPGRRDRGPVPGQPVVIG